MNDLICPASPLSCTPDDIMLVSVVRNEMTRLASFMAHYRALGVTRFLMVDNGSTDGTTAFLSAQSDVWHVQAPGSYGQANCGHDWILAMLEQCVGNWCVVADCDEFFIYPGHRQLPLAAFASELEAHGDTAVCSYLLDMYSPAPFADNVLRPGQDPLEVCRHFDPIARAEGRARKLYGLFPLQRNGGMRDRVFDVRPCLNKITLFRNLPGTYLHQGAHFIDGATLAPIHCATLHFKYLREFQACVVNEARRGEHFNDASEYRAYSRALESDAQLGAWHAGSRALACFDDFFAEGLWEARSARADVVPLRHGPARQSLLASAIDGAAGIALHEGSDADLAARLFSSNAHRGRPLVLLASAATAELWRGVAHRLGEQAWVIDMAGGAALDVALHAAGLQRLHKPVVVIEAVDCWNGRRHFVDLLIDQLARCWPDGATWLVDVSDLVIDVQLAHRRGADGCFFGRLPACLDEAQASHFISWGAQAGYAAHATPDGLAPAPAADLAALVQRRALCASAIRATLLEWDCALVETFKIVNSLAAFRPPRLVELSALADLQVTASPTHPGVLLIRHAGSMPATLLHLLHQLGRALGIPAAPLTAARRVLANADADHYRFRKTGQR